MMRVPFPHPRRMLLAALLVMPAAMAVASQPGHTQESSVEAGLWRDGNGDLWCGGGCNKSINQVCCTIVYPT